LLPMKKLTLFIIAVFITHSAMAQSFATPEYSKLVRKADSLYNLKDYKNSGFAYAAAFKANNGKAAPDDRYNAACIWTLANMPDSAFLNLNKLVAAGYTDYDYAVKDSDLIKLHNDKRWMPLLALLKANKDKAEANYNTPLVKELDSIYYADQGGRLKIDSIDKKYGRDSQQMKDLWASINKTDSINLIKVEAILDKYGWLGADVISSQGNTTLFLVIQHADMKTRDKYLPMLRAAVKNGKATGADLALMEDRSALEHGKKQIYGSQIARDANGKYYISPIEDEANVDKRRAAVGLGPLAEYAQRWGIVYKAPAQ
jgi:hypothetical protein